MIKKLIFTWISFEMFFLQGTPLPGRIDSFDVSWVQFGSTDVFFYMTPEKQALTKKIVEEINEEKVKLTIDINDFDCLTTEISAIASKYPDPIDYFEDVPVFADLMGHRVLETYAQALYAFSFKEEVGSDIEYIKPNLSIEDLPLSILSLEEQEELKQLPFSRRKIAFYKKWTEKESYLKAIGTGLQDGHLEIKTPNTPKWTYLEVPLPSDYIATICYSEGIINSI